MTSTNRIAIPDALNPIYPEEPEYRPGCGLNQTYQSLPPTAPGNRTPVEWETTAVGPSSVKHLYSGVANYYPIRHITRPIDTLYGHDFSKFHQSGAGRGKRIGYHYKAYPLTNRNVREVRDYADVILPDMDSRRWTKHSIRRDATVNSSVQTFPQAYEPDMR